MFTRRSGIPRPGASPAPPGLAADPRRATGPGAVLERVGAAVATWSLRLLLTGAAVVALAWVLGKLWDAVLPLLLGLFLASMLWPLTRLLRRFLPPAAAAALTLLLAIGVLAGLTAVLVPQVTGQWADLSDSVGKGVSDLQDWVAGPPFNLDTAALDKVVDQAVDKLKANSSSIAGGLLTGVSTVGNLVVHLVLAVVLCFFFLKDGPKFVPWLRSWVGPAAGGHLAELSVRCWANLSGFIRAQAAVGLVDAVFIGIGLWVLGVPFALPLAVLVFFGGFIPIVGAFVTGALAALVALVANGPTSALLVLALVVAVQQLEGHVLQPVLVGRAVDLHPALVILGVTTGGSLAGIAGAFLAVPFLAVVVTIVRYSREQFLARTRPAAAAADGTAAPAGGTAGSTDGAVSPGRATGPATPPVVTGSPSRRRGRGSGRSTRPS